MNSCRHTTCNRLYVGEIMLYYYYFFSLETENLQKSAIENLQMPECVRLCLVADSFQQSVNDMNTETSCLVIVEWHLIYMDMLGG